MHVKKLNLQQSLSLLSTMADRIDIVLFGATGFTGKYCIGEIHRLSKANGNNLTWALAGRSETKIKDVLKEYKNKIGDQSIQVPIITADVKDYDSLKKMTERARVVVNCTGPYRFYGEPVIKACLETGTHQVDVSGEPEYMETIQLKYHKAAQEKGIYIISACGFDCIPAEFGLVFTQKNFDGTLNSVETYLEGGEDPPIRPGSFANYGTWESLIHSVANANELRVLRRKLFPTRLPDFKPKLKPRSSIHKSSIIDAWCVPFLGADRSVMSRSQRYLFEEKKARPVQVQTYFGMHSIFTLLSMIVFGAIFNILVKYEFGRNLLLKHPKFFSGGMFAHDSPPEEKLARVRFSITCYGKGWSQKLADPSDDYTTAPEKTIVTKVSGINPGYGVTSTGVTLAAIVVLTEKDKLPQRGGVYPPAAALIETTYLKQLQENGLSFEIISRE